MHRFLGLLAPLLLTAALARHPAPAVFASLAPSPVPAGFAATIGQAPPLPAGAALRDLLVNLPFTDAELPEGLSTTGGAGLVPESSRGPAPPAGAYAVVFLLAAPAAVGEVTYAIFEDGAAAESKFEQDSAALSGVSLPPSALPQSTACAGSSAGEGPASARCFTLLGKVEVAGIATTAGTSEAADLVVRIVSSALDHLTAVQRLGPGVSSSSSPIALTPDQLASRIASIPMAADELPAGFTATLFGAAFSDGPAGTSYDLVFGIASDGGQVVGQLVYSVYGGLVDARGSFNLAAGQARQAGAGLQQPSGSPFPIQCGIGPAANASPFCSLLVGPVVVTAHATDAPGTLSLARVGLAHLLRTAQPGVGQ